MSDLNEKLVLNEQEKAFLKRVAIHWKQYKTYLVLTGDSKEFYIAESAFSGTEKFVARRLILEDLITVKMLPSNKMLMQPSNPRVNIGTTTFEVPVQQPVSEQNFFDWAFRPTEKGLDHCFVEEL